MSKRGKMPKRDNMSQYGKKDIVKQTGKMSQTGCFVTIQIKKRGHFVTATFYPPLGLGGWKIPGHFV